MENPQPPSRRAAFSLDLTDVEFASFKNQSTLAPLAHSYGTRSSAVRLLGMKAACCFRITDVSDVSPIRLLLPIFKLRR